MRKKWRIIREIRQNDEYFGALTDRDAVGIVNYSNETLREAGNTNYCRAIRIRNLVSIAGKTPEDLGMPRTPRDKSSGRSNAIMTLLGEYNGMGCHFIVLRPEVTMADFEIVVLNKK